MEPERRSRRRQKKPAAAGKIAAVLLLAAVFSLLAARVLSPDTKEDADGRKPSSFAVVFSEAEENSSSGTEGENLPYGSAPGETGSTFAGNTGSSGKIAFPSGGTENENSLESIAEKTPVTLTFAGDILFDSHYAIMASLLERSGGKPDISKAFDADLLEMMRSSDFFMVNNEFPYSDRGTPFPEKQYTFRADPSYAFLLAEMGADAVALANNHLFDYGEPALLDTLSVLQAEGIPYAGAGKDLEEASAPLYFTLSGLRVGILSATQIERMANPDTRGAAPGVPGVFRCLDPKNLIAALTEMKQSCDLAVLYLHWGTESTEIVDDSQKKLAKQLAEAGADLIIGDHPHVLQKMELLSVTKEDGTKKNVPVIYSLGNFLFNSRAQDTCLVTAAVDPETAEILSFRFIPARQENCRTRLLTGEEKERVLSYMRSLSSCMIDSEGYLSLLP